MLHYPYLLYHGKVQLFPLFPVITGDPLLVDMSPSGQLFHGLDARDQQAYQQIIEKEMGAQFTWGLSSYLEHRETLLGDCPQMVAEQRFIHLGLDIIVPLGTPLHAPLDGIVEEAGYESGEGNYGGYVLLRHESPCFETFFSFYGHRRRSSLPEQGMYFLSGHPFAEIGDFHENGNWFYHTHLQILTKKGFEQGYISKGYCSEKDLVRIGDFCPSPLYFFTLAR